MLVRFNSKVGMITMFGEVATTLLRTMGQSGAVPGAILAGDIPAAIQRLRRGVESSPKSGGEDESGSVPVNLRQRAFPLIELLDRAAASNADVIWEEEGKAL